MRRRVLAVAISVVLVLVVAGYAAASVIVYDRLTVVQAHCGGGFASDTPAAFTAGSVDASPYLMPDFQAVTFPSRDPTITLSAWWVPGAKPDSPAVIVVHGLGSCKREPVQLLPAGMLHRHGFAVLLIDLRDQGDSTVDDGRYKGGVLEYRDVLGAWDWLQRAHGLAAARIGLLGMSLGAGTVVIATGEEPRVAAVWEDSGFADVEVGIQDELARNGYPTFLAFGGILAGRLLHGVDVTSRAPAAEVARLKGRPIQIVHGTADTRVPVKHAYALVAAIRAAGGTVEPWILPGVTHVQAVFTLPAEYERRLVDFFSRALGSPTG